MKQAYRTWVLGLLAGLAVLLAACAAVVYVVDPCLYYRVPDKWQPVFFSELSGCGACQKRPGGHGGDGDLHGRQLPGQ